MGQFNLSLSNNFNLGGISYAASVALSGNVIVSGSLSVPAGFAGSVTTYSSSTSVIITTTNSSPGITTSTRCDVYWNGGYTFGATPSAVTGGALTFSAAGQGGSTSGNWPALSTAVIVSPCQVLDFGFVVANLQLFAAQTDFEALFVFTEASAATLDYGLHIPATVTTGNTYVSFWYTGSGASNPFSNTAPTQGWLSHADGTAAHTMSCGVLVT